jgi:hypothetical protein
VWRVQERLVDEAFLHKDGEYRREQERVGAGTDL